MSTDINIKKRITILEESAILTKDVNSIDFVGAGVVASTIGDDVTVTIGGGVGAITYYLNESVTQSPYKEFSSIVTTAVEQLVPLTVAGGVTSVIAEYQTPVGVPGSTQIAAGLWSFYLHFSAAVAGQNWVIRPAVWKRDLGGIETLLFTSDPIVVTNMATVTTMYLSDGVFPSTTLITTDRLVVRISMENLTGVNQTVTFRTEGSQHYSVATTTLNPTYNPSAVLAVTGTAPVVSSGGTTPAISIPQATGAVNGYLSSSDFAVFNAKVGGSGTTNYLSKFTGTGTIGNSQTQDNGSNIAVNGAILSAYKFAVYSTTPGENYNIYGNTTVNGAVGVAGVNQGVGASTNYGTSGTAQSSTGKNVGVYGQATGASIVNIGGRFSGTGATDNYSLQLQDGTEGVGKVLTSMTADGKAQWVALSTNIPQANKIYVDSLNGIDSTGRGNINSPYLTPEYALADITNTGTVTATTTSTSNTLTAVSSTVNIVVGQYITGTGIPFNTVVVSKTSNTIVMSQTATASATITATWFTVYELQLNGDFIATGNWLKECFYFGSNSSVNVSWGAFVLFNLITAYKTPYFNNCNFSFFGTTTTSKFFSNVSYVQTTEFTFSLSFNTITSVTVGSIFTNASTPYFMGTYTFIGRKVYARFGSVASFGWFDQNSANNFIIDYSYGLLGGITTDYNRGNNNWIGTMETPSSVYAFNISATSNWNLKGGFIYGSVIFNAAGGIKKTIENNISGTTVTLSNCKVYGSIPGSATLNGNVDLYGQCASYLTISAGYNRLFIDPVWGIVLNGSSKLEICAPLTLYNANINSTSTLIISAAVTSGGMNIASGAKMMGTGDLTTTGISVTGELDYLGNIIITSGSVTINTGGKVKLRNKLKSTVVSTSVPLIQKDAGTLSLFPGSSLIVANAKSPIKCSANTSTSKDIYLFNCVDNCDGSTYGLGFAFDGSSYVPNDLVGGIKYENIAYTF